MTANEQSRSGGGDGQSNGHRVVDRRRVLQGTAAVSAIGLAGCGGGGDGGDGGGDGGDGGDGGSTPTASGGDGSGGDDGDGGDGMDDGGDGMMSKEAAVEEWGSRINEHAQQAGIDWKQFEGTSLIMGMNVHPFTSLVENFLPHFEELTGISIQFNTFPEDQLWQKLTLDLNSGTGVFDGFMLGLWPSARYHNAGWAKDLNQYIDNASLTDQDWLALDDYPDAVLEAFTYGDDDFLAMPFGVESYGCIGYDRPTLEQVGMDAPTSYPAMRDVAKAIDEDTDRAGIASRASSTTLSSANWATMHRSYSADWVDYENKEAVLNSDEGIEALELFAEAVGDYGPQDIGTFDWYKANTAFGNGQLGMVYHTPSAIGVWGADQLERTEWIAPPKGPDGERVVDTWQWAMGISEFTSNPEAAWLFLQWSTGRPMIKLLNTRRWEGQPVYGPARTDWLFEEDDYLELGPKESWREAHRTGIQNVPSDPPPVPLHVPQNMDIMTEAALAMNSAVTDNKSAEEALNDAAPKITEFAKEIPDSYL